MSRIIEKKIWSKPFEKVLSGEKKFELRLADFDIEKGDNFHNHTPEEIEKYGWQVIGME